MKLGIVGLGSFNKAQHAPALMRYVAEVAPLDFVLCEPSGEQAAAWQKQFGFFPWLRDLDSLLASGKLDAAYVTVPPPVTCDVVERLLRAGIPTFTEKPPGMTTAETRRLVDAAGDTLHAVGFNRRFSPVLQRLKDMADQHIAGQLIMAACEFTRVRRYDADFTTTLIHGLDALRFLAGDVRLLHVEVVPVRGDRPVLSYHLNGRFADGALLRMTILPAVGEARERYALAGEDVTMEAVVPMPALNDPGGLRLWQGGMETANLSESDLGIEGMPDCVRFGFFGQARRFLDSVTVGRGPAGTSFAESLQSVELAAFIRNVTDASDWPERHKFN